MPDVFLKMLYQQLKANFVQNGGFRSKRNILTILLIFWGFYTFLKERGWLPKKQIRGKHVFLTGAGSGLGRQMAILLAKQGCKLSLCGLTLSKLTETKRLIKEATGIDDNVHCMQLDVCDKERIKECAAEAERVLGDVNIIINNAGVVQARLFHEMSEMKASQTMTINAESHFWIIKQFLSKMIQRDEGHIVTIASLAGTVGAFAGLADYSASKSAAYGMTESLRIEMKHLKTQIKVTCINPQFIHTGMFKGVKESLLWPTLNEKSVAKRVIQAIRQDEGEVSIYWLQGVLIWLCKAVMNSWLADKTLWLLNGHDHVLGPEYTGRRGPNDPLDNCLKSSDQARE